MTDHIILDYKTHIYECLHCGDITEPPWMGPSPDIADGARCYFVEMHQDCTNTESSHNVNS